MRKAVAYLALSDPRKQRRGVENVIFLQAHSNPYRSYYIFTAARDEVYRFEGVTCIGVSGGPVRYIRVAMVVRRLATKTQLFVHSHHYLMSLLLLRKTDLLTVHDALGYFQSNIRPHLKWIFDAIETLTYMRSGFVHFISEYARQMSRLPEKSSYRVIHNSTPMERLSRIDPSLSMTSKWPFILVVRSIDTRYNLDILFPFARFLSTYDPEKQIIVVGKGPLLEHYRERAQDYENLTFLGFVETDALVGYYKNAELVLVTAGWGEGFGIPVIEGYLFGKRVLAPDICALPEVIADDADLYENRADSLIGAYRRGGNQRGTRFYYAQYRRFSNDEVMGAYKSLYEELFP